VVFKSYKILFINGSIPSTGGMVFKSNKKYL
jgi:hypothetical protein